MKCNALTCDRCKKEISRGGHKVNMRELNPATQFDKDVREMDLCDKCWSAFEAFMDNRAGKGSGVPKGFKRVQRPCPHHVPCAEPWGCSGDELVPI